MPNTQVDPPQSVLTGAKLWRYSVLTYLVSLVLMFISNILMLDTLRQREIDNMAQRGLEATSAQVTTSMWVSLGTWLLIPAIGAAATWFLSYRLLDRSPAARMLLSILMVVFVVMGIMAVFRYLGDGPIETFGNSAAGAFYGLGVLLSAIAPIIAAIATFLIHKDLMPNGKRFFETT